MRPTVPSDSTPSGTLSSQEETSTGAQATRRWAALLMLMLAHAVNDGFEWVIPPLLPAIREHFQLSYTEMGAFTTFFRFFGNLLQAPAAYLVRLAPASTILVGGLLWSSVGMFLASFSASYAVLVWASAVSGIGRSTYHPLAVSMISRIFGKELLGRAIGLHLASSAIGQMVAPLLVVLLVGIYGWRVPLQVWSCLGVVAGLSLFAFLRRRKIDFQAKGKAWHWPFVSRPLGIYLLAMSVWGITQSGMTTFLPLFLVDRHGFSIAKSAAVYGLISLAGALCRPLLGALMDWMGRRKPVIHAGFIISGVAIVGLTAAQSSWLVYLCVVMLGIFLAGHSGLADTFMVELIPPHRREETIGFAFTPRMGTAAAAPILVGFFSERIGMNEVFWILGLISMASAGILSLAKERDGSQAAP
jgi:predicted MFS family arabinose efflux permease